MLTRLSGKGREYAGRRGVERDGEQNNLQTGKCVRHKTNDILPELADGRRAVCFTSANAPARFSFHLFGALCHYSAKCLFSRHFLWNVCRHFCFICWTSTSYVMDQCHVCYARHTCIVPNSPCVCACVSVSNELVALDAKLSLFQQRRISLSVCSISQTHDILVMEENRKKKRTNEETLKLFPSSVEREFELQRINRQKKQ